MIRRLPSMLLLGLLLGMIRAYQIVLAPLIGARCRFAPSCSHYTAKAISTHGPGTGLWLGARRILKCHPWGTSGFDPVPPAPLHPISPYKTELK